MPNLKVSDVVTKARSLLNDMQPTGRWSDTRLISFANDASRAMNRDIMFPGARWVISTNGNQEYPIEPAVLRTDAVYLDGQPIAPVDAQTNFAATLEGHQDGVYDQSYRSGTIPGAGAGAAQGGSGAYSPQWVAETPTTYPYANTDGGPNLASRAAWPGQSPRYYWRGGWLGILPQPSTVGQILELWGIAIVPKISALTDDLYFSDAFELALGWKVVELASFADDSTGSPDRRNWAASQYESETRKWRMWNRRRTGDAPNTPKGAGRGRSAIVRGRARFGGTW